MSSYRIFETDEFLRNLDKLDPPVKAFVENKLKNDIYLQLRQQPFFGKHIKKLKGYPIDIWRYRIGKFRIFYTVDDGEHILYILSIDHRKGAYR